MHSAENDAEAQVATVEVYVASSTILQVKFQSLQSHSRTIAEIITRQDLVENHFVLVAAYGDFLDYGSLSLRSYRAVSPQIRAMDVDVSNALQLQIAAVIGEERSIKATGSFQVA